MSKGTTKSRQMENKRYVHRQLPFSTTWCSCIRSIVGRRGMNAPHLYHQSKSHLDMYLFLACKEVKCCSWPPGEQAHSRGAAAYRLFLFCCWHSWDVIIARSWVPSGLGFANSYVHCILLNISTKTTVVLDSFPPSEPPTLNQQFVHSIKHLFNQISWCLHSWTWNSIQWKAAFVVTFCLDIYPVDPVMPWKERLYVHGLSVEELHWIL